MNTDKKIKYLFATARGQGIRKSDYNHVPEGEPLMFGFECDCDRGDVDGHCGCRRGLCGVICEKATTTFVIRAVTNSQLLQIENDIRAHLMKGWGYNAADASKEAKIQVAEIVRIAEMAGEETVCEKRGDVIKVRDTSPNAIRIQ